MRGVRKRKRILQQMWVGKGRRMKRKGKAVKGRRMRRWQMERRQQGLGQEKAHSPVQLLGRG
jgi:hypothetical protein